MPTDAQKTIARHISAVWGRRPRIVEMRAEGTKHVQAFAQLVDFPVEGMVAHATVGLSEYGAPRSIRACPRHFSMFLPTLRREIGCSGAVRCSKRSSVVTTRSLMSATGSSALKRPRAFSFQRSSTLAGGWLGRTAVHGSWWRPSDPQPSRTALSRRPPLLSMYRDAPSSAAASWCSVQSPLRHSCPNASARPRPPSGLSSSAHRNSPLQREEPAAREFAQPSSQDRSVSALTLAFTEKSIFTRAALRRRDRVTRASR
jgi:hypothetical protein